MPHTPGPWKIKENNLGCKEIIHLHHKEEEVLFTIIEIGYTNGVFNEAEDLANARLIAAAPDLLAIARALCDMLSQRDLYPMLNFEETRLLHAANSLVMSLTEPPQECDNCGDCRD